MIEVEAGARAGGDRFAAGEAAGEQDGGHARDVGAVAGAGDQEEADRLLAALGVGAGEEHVQAAAAGAEAVEQGAGAEQALREAVERRQQAGADEAAQRPGAEMEQGDLVAGAEADRLQLGIAGREEIEIGNVAIAEQAAAELGIGLGDGGPASHGRSTHCAVLQGGEGPADIGEDRRGGGEAAIGLLGGADPVIDRVEPGEVRGGNGR